MLSNSQGRSRGIDRIYMKFKRGELPRPIVPSERGLAHQICMHIVPVQCCHEAKCCNHHANCCTACQQCCDGHGMVRLPMNIY
jgi:hypothetical protein